MVPVGETGAARGLWGTGAGELGAGDQGGGTTGDGAPATGTSAVGPAVAMGPLRTGWVGGSDGGLPSPPGGASSRSRSSTMVLLDFYPLLSRDLPASPRQSDSTAGTLLKCPVLLLLTPFLASIYAQGFRDPLQRQ
jgi:hypothetical protein